MPRSNTPLVYVPTLFRSHLFDTSCTLVSYHDGIYVIGRGRTLFSFWSLLCSVTMGTPTCSHARAVALDNSSRNPNHEPLHWQHHNLTQSSPLLSSVGDMLWRGYGMIPKVLLWLMPSWGHNTLGALHRRPPWPSDECNHTQHDTPLGMRQDHGKETCKH